MKEILLVTYIVISISINIYSQSTVYVSPGISISWGGGATIMFGWKLSLGYMFSEKYYYNITFGKQITLNESKFNQKNYEYLEIQRGGFWSYYPLSVGGGLGVSFFENQIFPKLSIFGGELLFLHFNYTFNRNSFDLGGNLVLPIPFNKEYRNLNPG